MIARMPSRRWVPVLQMLCSLALMAWLIVGVHWTELWAALAHASPLLIAIGCCVYYLGILLSCLKWRITLRVEEIDLPLSRLLPWYLIGAFAGNFLPTDIGGDLGRGFITGRATGRPLAVARSILVERLSGLAMMVVLAWFGFMLLPMYRGWALFALALAVGGILIFLTVWRIAWGHPLLTRMWVRLPVRLRAALTESLAVADLYRRRPGVLALVLLISLVFQSMAGFGLWLNLQAVGVILPLLPVILVGMIVGVIGLLPITVNGWGLREATIIALLAPLGTQAAGVLAGALLGRGLQLLLSLPGAPLLLFEQRHSLVKR